MAARDWGPTVFPLGFKGTLSLLEIYMFLSRGNKQREITSPIHPDTCAYNIGVHVQVGVLHMTFCFFSKSMRNYMVFLISPLPYGLVSPGGGATNRQFSFSSTQQRCPKSRLLKHRSLEQRQEGCPFQLEWTVHGQFFHGFRHPALPSGGSHAAFVIAESLRRRKSARTGSIDFPKGLMNGGVSPFSANPLLLWLTPPSHD